MSCYLVFRLCVIYDDYLLLWGLVATVFWLCLYDVRCYVVELLLICVVCS